MEQSPPPNDLKAIRDAFADAAGVSAGLWLSYLFVLFYLLVAIGGVTHRDMFLQNPIRLPFLSVDLPLEGFCWLGPLLFLVVHAYVLLHFVLLAGKARVFDAQIQQQTADPGARERLQWQLPINTFVQLLAGPHEVRRGPTGALLLSIRWISLVFGPVMLLVFFEFRFLPYHDEWITWWQRTAVAVDLALLWVLWPAAVRDGAVGKAGPGTALALTFVSLVAVPLVFAVATFPGERWEEVLPAFPLRQTLVAGDIDPETSRPTSLWSNRLVLPGLDIVDHTKFDTMAKIAAAPVMTSLRSRHLQRAVLIDASLPRVDFTGANLEGASFSRARLQGAWFDHAALTGARLDDAQLQGASFYQARLHGASLNRAQLQGAPLAGAQLQGAWLAGAQLQGASLAGADLRGVLLAGADLRGVNLYQARLQGASLDGAQLRGASLKEASVWRADFRNVKVDAPAVRIDGIETGPKTPVCEGLPKDACGPGDTLDSFRRIVERYLPVGVDRDYTLVRLGANLDPATPLDGEMELERSRMALEALPPAGDAGEENLAELWFEIACAVDGAPFVLTSLIGTIGDPSAFRFNPNSRHLPKLAADLLVEKCAARPEMPELAKMQLVEIRELDGRLPPRATQSFTQSAVR